MVLICAQNVLLTPDPLRCNHWRMAHWNHEGARNQEIVAAYDREFVTYRDLALKYGMTRQRIHQVIASEGNGRPGFRSRMLAVRRARKRLKLKPFLRGVRFWSRVDRSGDGCWPWTGSTYPASGSAISGYGHTRRGDENGYAHRDAWEFANGKSPGGLCVLHRCDNPICCKPGHLFLGTVGDNARDRAAKGRSAGSPNAPGRRKAAG